ncbi:MAG: hypothetical protein ACOX9C_08075 [Kiritimatiellia bacterium]|jgi:hypothetical protein
MKVKKLNFTRRRRCRLQHAAVHTACMLVWLAAAAAAPAAPLARVFKQDAVEVNMRIDPPVADPAKNTEIVIELTRPESIHVALPDDMAGRFEGFALEGSYVAESASASGAMRTAHHFNLRPVPGAERHRIRPLAIRMRDASSHPPRTTWFATEMITIPASSPDGDAPETVETALKPRYIRPSMRGVGRVALMVVGGALAVALLWLLGSHIAIARKVRRMTPRERALRELERLISRALPEKGLFKDFYVELTLVVRRYVERRHGFRAPKQTTEEFLASAADHPDFDAKTVQGLKAFLTAADLVKFAGVKATIPMTDEATAKAKAYLESQDEALDGRTTPTQEAAS